MNPPLLHGDYHKFNFVIIIRTLADNNEMRKGFAALAAKEYCIGRRVLEQIARTFAYRLPG